MDVICEDPTCPYLDPHSHDEPNDDEPGRDTTGAMLDEIRLDRWLEALLGARLRFHIPRDTTLDPADAVYWTAIYRRWQHLFIAGKEGRLVDDNG